MVNLLETTMFYRETCEATEDCVLDLIDYCYRKLSHLVSRYVIDNLNSRYVASFGGSSVGVHVYIFILWGGFPLLK